MSDPDIRVIGSAPGRRRSSDPPPVEPIIIADDAGARYGNGPGECSVRSTRFSSARTGWFVACCGTLAEGHVLIESVPGLGKTLLVRALGRVLGCAFNRIQFTPDLMPSDVTGAPIFDERIHDFRFRPGPVFTQLLLADEINRAPAKTPLGAAGDHAGEPRNDRRSEPSHRSAVPGAGDSEPDRVGGDLQPARGPARPLLCSSWWSITQAIARRWTS